MTNRMKSRFLMTTAALLAGVSLASAQGPIGGGGAGSEKGMSAPGASRGEGMTQGRATESREGGRTEESGRAQRDEPAMRDRSGTGQNVTQGQTNAPAQGQAAAPPQGQTPPPAQGQAAAPGQGQTTAASQTRTNLTAQQQTTLQQSVLQASNAPRVNANSINFQVHTGVALPSSISVVSVSTYPALIDVFPAYRSPRIVAVGSSASDA